MPAVLHPAVERMLKNFRYDHLPPALQKVSKPFHDLAHQLAETLSGPEVTKALDSLWESKNWTVVAASTAALEGTAPTALPTTGDVVHYRLTAADADAVNKRRTDFHTSGSASERTGFVGHFGNRVEEGDTFPAVVVRVWNESTVTCNLQVLLDGTDVYWATSRAEGDEAGRWSRKVGA